MGSPLDTRRRAADHDESFEELVAAEALGSITPDDAVRLRPHLVTCASCQALLAEYGVVVASLPLSVPEAPANPELKARLLTAATSLPVPAPARQEERYAPERQAPALSTRRRWAWRNLRPAYAFPLAALLLVSLGLGWWSLQLREQVHAQQAQLERQSRFIAAVAAGAPATVLTGTDQAPAARGEVVQPSGGGPPLLVVQGLPTLPRDQAYQIWVIAGGQPAGAGLLQPTNSDSPIVPLERDLGGAQVVALTIEPLGGSPAPTGPIVLAGNL